MALCSVTRWCWLVAVLASLQTVSHTNVAASSIVYGASSLVIEQVVRENLHNHCPSKAEATSQELRIINSTRAAFREVQANVLEELHKVELSLGKTGSRCCSCPKDFILCAGRCYTLLDTVVDYAKAEQMCAEVHGHLAVPRSHDENLCAAGMARHEHVWLGFTDREHEGVFMGADGLPITGNGSYWLPNNPSNTGGNEDCVVIWPAEIGNKFGEWNDLRCTGSGYNTYPLCQLS